MGPDPASTNFNQTKSANFSFRFTTAALIHSIIRNTSKHGAALLLQDGQGAQKVQ